MLKNIEERQPAIVKFHGIETDYIDENGFPMFTPGQCYKAYLLEYWEGQRDSLHVQTNNGTIVDFVLFSDFEIIQDPDEMLNLYEAKVRCISHKYDDLISGVTYGNEYPAIGCDKDGLFLVMDDSLCCYFYNPDFFEIIGDTHGLLEKQTIYYSFDKRPKAYR